MTYPLKVFLAIPLPDDYSNRVGEFRLTHSSEWASRPMRSNPHLSIKGGRGLDGSQSCVDMVKEVAARHARFRVKLGPPGLFDTDPEDLVLYLGIESPGWWALHRDLVETTKSRTDKEMHPLEIEGWVPHVTLMRLSPAALDERQKVLAAVEAELAPYPSYQAGLVAMLRWEDSSERYVPYCDFKLGRAG